jgi:hypothetical protein
VLKRALDEAQKLNETILRSWSWRALTPLHRALRFLRGLRPR